MSQRLTIILFSVFTLLLIGDFGLLILGKIAKADLFANFTFTALVALVSVYTYFTFKQ